MINPNAGDFRENLIPIEVNACNSVDPGQKWDIITKGNHDNQPGFALIVSSLVSLFSFFCSSIDGCFLDKWVSKL